MRSGRLHDGAGFQAQGRDAEADRCGARRRGDSASIFRPGHQVQELAQAESDMAAMARDPAGLGLALDDGDVAQAQALQLRRGGEARRSCSQDDNIAGDHSFSLPCARAATFALQ